MDDFLKEYMKKRGTQAPSAGQAAAPSQSQQETPAQQRNTSSRQDSFAAEYFSARNKAAEDYSGSDGLYRLAQETVQNNPVLQSDLTSSGYGTRRQTEASSGPSRHSSSSHSSTPADPYKGYTSREDWEELSKPSGSKIKLFGSDQRYDYINNIGNYQLTQDAQMRAGDWYKYHYMTDEEIGVYNYIYATEGKKAANNFLESIDPELGEQRYKEQSKLMTDAATSSTGGKVAASALTVLAEPARTVYGLMSVGQDIGRMVSGKEINPYSRLKLASQTTQDVRSGISKDMSGVGRFAYNTAMSALDSAVNMAFAGALGAGLGLEGEAAMKATNMIGSALMSSEVASMAISEGKQKGYSDIGATSIGLIRGAVEYATEALGGEWVIKNIKANPLNFVKSMLLNMIPEGTEEVMSDAANGVINLIVDKLFGTEESGIPALLEHFEKEGKPWQKENPWLATILSILGDEALSFLSGSFATLGSSGVQTRNVRLSINQTAQRLNTTQEDVVKLMEDYQMDNPGNIYALAELYDAKNTEELRERVADSEAAHKAIDEAYRNDARMRSGAGTVQQTTDTAADTTERFLRGQASTAETKSAIQNTFRNSNIELNDSESDILTSGFEAGNTDPETYLLGTMDAYKLGKSGNFTLEEAIRASKHSGSLTESQFRHAWELGSMRTTTKTNTADVKTEAGKEKLSSALASLGKYSDQAANAYEDGQDLSTYAAAMEKAAVLYAANGIDLETVVQQAREGKTSDIVGRLTDTQVAVAAKIGQQMRSENTATVRQLSAQYNAIRQQASELAAGNAQAISNIDNAIKEATAFGKKALATFNSQLQELESMVKDNPDVQNSEEYAKLFDEASENKRTVQEMQKAIQELQEKKKALESEKTAKKKGSVTLSEKGGSIQGVEYNAVDESKLTDQQKTIVDACRTIADVTGLDIVIVEAKGNFGGAYIGDGKIFLNISSGMNLNTFSKAIAAGSLSHEMTHWMKEKAPSEYEALKQIVIDSMSSEQLDKLVQEQLHSQPDLSYEEAVDEVVANACQPMLQDSKAIEQLARQNMTLAEKIADFIHQFVEKIKAAFAEIDFHDNIQIFHAVQAVENAAEQIQNRFDAALKAAAENSAAEETVNKKKTASEGGVKYQKIGDSESESIKEQIQANSARLNEMKPAVTVHISDMPKGVQKQRQWVINRLKNTGYAVHNREIGTIEFTPRQINTGLNYLNSSGEIAAFAALPSVLKRGEIIDQHGMHKNRPRGSITIAAPVVINDVRGNMAVVLTQTSKTHYHTHRILMPDGSAFIFENENAGATPAEDQSDKTNVSRPSLRRSEESIADVLKNSKPSFQMISDVEATDDLVAVHNKSVSGLRRMLERNGVPFPSIAVKKAGTKHTGFGDISIVFPRSSIDPQVNRQNRLYSNDAWTPTEPRTEYDVGDMWRYTKVLQKELGSEIYKGLRGDTRLDSDAVRKSLENNNGDVFNALKNVAVLRYAYLDSIGQTPGIQYKEDSLDGSYKYKNSQLTYLFDNLSEDEINSLSYDDKEGLQAVTDLLNKQFVDQFREANDEETSSKMVKALMRKPLYEADDVNPIRIQDAYRKYQANGGKTAQTIDFFATEDTLNKNKALDEDPGFKEWIENKFKGLIVDSGIRNDKDIFTPSGNRRSFKQLHVPATLDNIVREMQKQQETGIGVFGTNLRGAATKQYSTVEDMRAESGKLLGEKISDDEYDSIMNGFYSRLNEMTDRIVKTTNDISSWQQADSVRETLTETIRDAKSKARMRSMLQAEERWFPGISELADDLWDLRNDVQNMPAPYFEAKPRRIVYPGEALAFIVPDNIDTDTRNMLDSRGYNVLTYEAGNEDDRLAKLNSVENAKFQTWEEDAPVQQEISSAATSINANKLPVLYTNKNAEFTPGGVNIDVGGGRFDNVTEYLAEKDVTNLVFDPYNRDDQYNRRTLKYLTDGNKADTATCSNCLNVIREAAARDNVILECAKAIKEAGKAYFTVYEGDGSGEGKVTKAGWQENRKTASYAEEISKYFDNVTVKGKLIIAENPKADLPKAAWETSPGKAIRFQAWDEPSYQISLDDWMSGGKQSSSLNPVIQARIDAAAEIEQKVKDFFHTIDEDSDLWLSDEEIDEFMDYDVYGNSMGAADEIIQNLSDLSKENPKGRTKIYALMEDLIPYVSIGSQDVWIYQGDSRNEDFASWYSKRHPSLYYPGYKAGDLSSGHLRGENKENVAKEIKYLKTLLRRTTLSESDRVEAQDMLDGLQQGKIYYQRWDEIYDDTPSESEERELSYSRLRSENAILKDTIDSLRKLANKKDTTIDKLQKQLHLSKTQEVRESDAKKLARTLTKEYGSKVNTADIASQLKEIGDYILQTPASEISEDSLLDKARTVAARILNEAVETVDVDNQIYSEIYGEIKGKKLSIDEAYSGELDQYGGFNDFRKSLFGTLTLSKRENNSRESRDGYASVDQFYADLQGQFGEGLFPDVANEGEQIQVIAELSRAGKPIEVNPFERYIGEATEDMANRIVMDAMNGILRPDTTYADQQKSRRVALQEKIKELKAENAMDQREAARLYQTIYDLSIDLDKAESRYESLRQDAAYRDAQLREEGAARAAEAYALARERTARRMKNYYHELMMEQKERREESAGVAKYRKQIEKKAEKLYEMLVKNTDKQHVPEILKKPVAEFLSSLDFSSKRSLRGGDETQRDMAFGAKLLEIQQILSNQQDYINGTGDPKSDLGGYVDISPESMEFLKNAAEEITKSLSENKTYTINQMTASQLKELSKFLSSLNAGIRNMNYFMANARYESVKEAASGDIDAMNELGKADDSSGNSARNLFVWTNGVPYYIFKRYGKGGQSIFEGFTKGWEKMAFNAQEIIDFTEKTYTDNEVQNWKLRKRRIELSNGKTIVMTDAQIMEFAMLLKREQALKHIEKGGVRIGNIDQGLKGPKVDTEHYHFTVEDISKITGLLSARQLEVAGKLQQYMAKKGSEWGNEVSRRRFGYDFYTEGENYFPIKTDSNDRPMADTDAQMNSMFRLLNLSSSKALNPKASNALIVNDIFDTFADHMSDMAKLNGMGLPVLDAIKWFNYKERIDNPDGTYDTRTLQAAMEQAFGNPAQHYFRTLMKDINGVNEAGDRGAKGFAGLMGNFKAAAVGANLRVALLQPTSYVRALTVIKPQYLAGAFTQRNAYKEAMKYSGTAVWKSLGYYDTDIAKSMRSQIEHADNLRDKIVEASMKGAELGDKLTWGRLWVACRMQSKAENRSLKGDALMEATNNLFREVIYSSQVMDSTLTRSEWMRSKSNFDKLFTPFMAEPTLSYNILLNAASDLKLDERRLGKAEAWKRNAGKIGKAFSVYLISAAFNALAESVWDAFRDDDDYETFWEKFLQALFGEKNLLDGNLIQDILITNKLPIFKDVVSMLSGYSSSNIATDSIRNLYNAAQIWWETWKLQTGELEKATKITYYGKMTEWGKIYKTLQALSQLSGYPASSFTRDVIAIWNTMMNGRKDEWKIRTYDGSSLSENNEAGFKGYAQPAGITISNFKKILDDADVNGGSNPTQDELGTYLENELAAGRITEEQAQALWKSRWHSEKSKTFDKWRSEHGMSTSTASTAPATATKSESAAAPASGMAAAAKPSTQRAMPGLPFTGAAAFKMPTAEEDDSIKDYAGFKASDVPIYSDSIDSAYALWEKNVAPLGIDLDTYVDIVKEANADGAGTSTQNEMGRYLLGRVNSGTLTYEQASAIWGSIWSKPNSKTFDKWVRKNG